jgi:WD40 repeat protein
MLRSIFLCLVIGGGIAAVVLYFMRDRIPSIPGVGWGPSDSSAKKGGKKDDPAANFGEPLAANCKLPAAVESFQENPLSPITGHGNLTPYRTQEVSCQLGAGGGGVQGGQLKFVATEITKEQADRAANDPDVYSVPFYLLMRLEKRENLKNYKRSEIYTSPSAKGRPERYFVPVRETDNQQLQPNGVHIKPEYRYFRRLKEGDRVEKGQLLALIDPSLADDELYSSYVKLEAKESDRKASEKTRDEAWNRYKRLETLRTRQQGVVSAEEIDGAFLTYQRYVLEEAGKGGEVKVAGRDLSKAATALRMHEIRSAITGKVRTIYKKAGEAVKSLEPVVLLQDQDNLQLECYVELQKQQFLPPGKKVVIEASVQQPEQRRLIGHIGEVLAVAVSHDKDPLVVSAGIDETVRVWDTSKGEKYRYRHNAAVRAVACTSPLCKENLCLSGDGAGVGRIWDLARDGTQEPRLLKEQHRGAINTVAFSPDGKYCATGGDDGIRLWNTADGSPLYTLGAGHRGGVTSIHFTVKGEALQLVSAGRDNSLLVWSLGTTGARLEESLRFDRRGGEVTTLGISPDGRRVLFDTARELRVLSLDTGRTEAVIRNPQGSANFEEMALFSPDGRMVLTAMGSEGRLQLWRLPTAQSRAHELRQLIWTSSPSTCGAFSPFAAPAGAKQLLATGTKDGTVVIWDLPNADEVKNPIEGVIELSDPVVESSQRQVRVRARITNRGDRKLFIGNTATLVAYPE